MAEMVTDPKQFGKMILRQLLLAYARNGKIPSLNVKTTAELDAIILLVEAELISMGDGVKAAKKMIERIGG